MYKCTSHFENACMSSILDNIFELSIWKFELNI